MKKILKRLLVKLLIEVLDDIQSGIDSDPSANVDYYEEGGRLKLLLQKYGKPKK